jgi:PAS domain S-box-containing protein
VLASSPAALWSAERAPGPDVTAGWQFRYVSPLLARLAGRPAEYFDHPFKWAEVVHPSDREAYRLGLRRLLTGPAEDAEMVYRVTALDGAVRWVRDRLQVIRDASGRPTRLDGCLVDVTEQRQAEEALRQSEQRFRALVEKSRDGIFLIDERGLIRYATAAVRQTLGHQPSGLLGREIFSLVDAEDQPAMRQALAQTLQRPGEDFSLSFRAKALDGSCRVVEANACNRLDDPSVRAIVLNYRDVTEQADASREIARQHALLQGLFASVPDIICYKDRNLRYLGGNPAFEQLAGRPMSEIIGKHCSDLFHGDWAQRLRSIEASILATGKTIRVKDWIPFPDGRKALLDISISPLYGGDGEPNGLIIVGRDVTEQNRLEEELRQSHKLEAVGRLAGGIAHDFNNLLTVILGNLELVRSGAAGEETSELLEAIERAARQAADLTRQMLGFARRQPLRTTTLDLNALVQEAVGMLRRTIDPRIDIRLRPAADLRPIAVDPVQIQQVLMNLCLNARDAMPDGGILTIETAAAPDARPPGNAPNLPEGGFVRMTVTDTGIGMTEEVRARIFEPFFTTKDVSQGTGLGLSVVYGVARAHGGWVECSSKPGAGTRFDVYLPVGIASDDIVPLSETIRPQEDAGHGETVLVADDEPLVRDLARSALERRGYRPLMARDGAEAVELFRSEREAGRPVELVVLDVSMPVLSGRQAFEAIRRIEPEVPVLFASGHPISDSNGDARVGFLLKPYTPSSLAAAVRRAINNPGK